jgi:8-oxo-dGTP pyrophosphatase MutT (NUDIX family)
MLTQKKMKNKSIRVYFIIQSNIKMSLDKNIKFSINYNKFKNPQYLESEDGTISDFPKDEEIWTIKNPSETIIKFYQENYPNVVLRKYLDNIYLMSSLAAEKIRPYGSGQGSCCIIRFKYKDASYFLLFTDNKPYVQNCQGGALENENMVKCMLRELFEEGKIIVKEKQLQEIGNWSFIMSNSLVDCSWKAETTLFFAELDYEQIEHLLTNELKEDDVTIFDASKYDFKLDETKFILTIPEKVMEDMPDKIMDRTFNGHHRECIHRLLKLSKSYPVNYLNSFIVNV